MALIDAAGRFSDHIGRLHRFPPACQAERMNLQAEAGVGIATRETGRGGMAGTPLVRIRGLVKTFGAFVANDHVDLDLWRGEAHALLGENGAGKSTLVKMLYGLLQPNAGTIEWNGERVTFRDPRDARRRGIGMVFQHFSLFDNLTVAENIALVMPPAEKMAGLADKIRGLEARYGLALEPGRPVWRLTAGERQRIEIARCLLQSPELIVLDEPTSVLTPQEAETLFATLQRLKGEGKALLYISHRLEEIARLCERATILRRGKLVGTCDPKTESPRSMAALMVGTQINDIAIKHAAPGAARFEVRALSMPTPDLHGTALDDISFAVRGGEILGIAGVAGNGQPELFAALAGEVACDVADRLFIDGQPVGLDGINLRRRKGAAFVPEERNGHAAVPDFTLSENTILSRHATGGLARHGLIDDAASKALSRRIIEAFDVRRDGPDPLARTLSGGNLQKFVMGREILRDPSVLVVNQPTWGVDALAAAAIRQALVDLAAKGAAVVVISQDLDELFDICDAISVMHAGRLSPPRPAHSLSREDIGLLMAGKAAHGESIHAH
jgi:ABC-type uncharacterized transport system ATPase subunit